MARLLIAITSIILISMFNTYLKGETLKVFIIEGIVTVILDVIQKQYYKHFSYYF